MIRPGQVSLFLLLVLSFVLKFEGERDRILGIFQGLTFFLVILECHSCAAFSDTRAVKIVTGSHKGLLRVFAPRKQGFQIDDLLLETSLTDSQGEGEPILQLLAGHFLR